MVLGSICSILFIIGLFCITTSAYLLLESVRIRRNNWQRRFR